MNALKFAVLTAALLVGLPDTALLAEPNIEILRNRTFVERDSGSLLADVYRPKGDGPFPGMLVVHGGAWRMGARANLAAIAAVLASNGYVAVAIDYRHAPQNKFPAQIYDCQAAVRWMREHAKELKIEPTRIGGFGYSAGGHLVALLGTLSDKEFREKGVPENAPSARLQVVVAGGAPCDFRPLPADSERLSYWLGGTQSKKPNEYHDASPCCFITADDPPMYFFHGKQDMLVPVDSPTKMVGLLKDAGVTAEIYAIKDAGHAQALFDRTALAQGLAFADRYPKVKDAASGKPIDAATPAPATAAPIGGGQ